MRAAVLHGREDVRVERVPLPEPGPGEVVLRARAALTCGTDVKVFRRGYHAKMIVPPALFGHELAGDISAVGEGVTGFAIGDRVVAANSAPCDSCPYCRRGRPALCDDLLFWNGAYAEFVRLPARVVARNLIHIDPAVDYREAAMVEPLACVVKGVQDCGITAGMDVAVIGVGPIGLMFVALARSMGARVVAAGRRPERLERARSLGASTILSLADAADPAARLRYSSPGGHGFDVVVEAVGHAITAEAAVGAARKGGTVNLFAGPPAGTRIAVDVAILHYDEITLTSSFHHTPDTVRKAHDLIARGVIRPRDLLHGEAALDELPTVLREMAAGDRPLKTAILP